MTATKEYAYAKINLFLDVLEKREDGFHGIKTVMHTVSLCDEITVAISPARETTVKITVEGSDIVPTDGKNLAHKAATLFLEHIGKCADVRIKLVKKIPVAGGLAGGSSDAAAVLRALNTLYKKPLTLKALLLLAEKLGSDVPYCVVGKTALCLGRGEIMEPLACECGMNFVIASSLEHISTPAAYSALDKLYSDFDGSIKTGGAGLCEDIIERIAKGNHKGLRGFNVFEGVTLPLCPGADALKKRLEAEGADLSMMSGSGPTVFGMFLDKEKAKAVADKLSSEGIVAYFAESVL